MKPKVIGQILYQVGESLVSDLKTMYDIGASAISKSPIKTGVIALIATIAIVDHPTIQYRPPCADEPRSHVVAPGETLDQIAGSLHCANVTAARGGFHRDSIKAETDTIQVYEATDYAVDK